MVVSERRIQCDESSCDELDPQEVEAFELQ